MDNYWAEPDHVGLGKLLFCLAALCERVYNSSGLILVNAH